MIATQNESWGFWGTWSRRMNATPQSTKKAWARAVRALVELGGFTPEQARQILDSRIGRHMADQVRGSYHGVFPTIEILLAHKGWSREMREAAELEEAR